MRHSWIAMKDLTRINLAELVTKYVWKNGHLCPKCQKNWAKVKRAWCLLNIIHKTLERLSMNPL